MAIFGNRLPSKHDAFLLFAACTFPIHFWATLNSLWVLPAWVLRSNLWNVVGMIAYTQGVALLESAVVFLVLVFIGAILPARFFRERLIAQGSMIVFVTSVWAIGIHYSVDKRIDRQLPSSWPSVGGLLWFALFVALVGMACVLVYRHNGFKKLVESFVERLTVLAWFYLCLDLLSIIILVLRNV